jgi:DNA-directed RNA polymerase specialized sigma24 family protein
MRVCQSDLPAAVAAPSSAGRLKLEDRFVKLFDELWLPVYKYLFRAGLRSEEAEDIAQEAFLRLFKQMLEQRDGKRTCRAGSFASRIIWRSTNISVKDSSPLKASKSGRS